MTKALYIPVAALVSVMVLSGTAYATTVENNRGSVVKIQGSCHDLLAAASNNRGSIVKIEGDSQCNAEDLLKEDVITNNRGSIIKISNVCGDVSKVEAVNNRGSIVKVESTGPCKTNEPTTVVVEDKTEAPATDAPKVDTSKKQEEGKILATSTTDSNIENNEAVATPDAMPQSGPADVLAAAGMMSVFGYIASRMLRKHNA